MRKGLLALVTVVALSALTFPAQAIQCVPYARQISGIDLKGDAWMWWNAAAGHYDRGRTPQTDAVMVFSRQGAMRYGHVSVVSKVVNSRMILVDHANWAPARSAGRGAITKLVPVIDVSAKNDWTKVRVWYEPSSAFGSKVYRADGFVYNPTRRTVPAKAGVQKIALTRTTVAVSAMGKQRIDLDADFSDIVAQAPVAVETASQGTVASHETSETVKTAAVTPTAAKKAEAPSVTEAPTVIAVAAITPEITAPKAPVKEAPAVAEQAAPTSIEVNDNLGSAIAVAKASFGPRGTSSGFMFN